MKTVIVLAFFLASLCVGPAAAQTRITGQLAATAACPALQSIRKATNPGGITLVVGTSYKIIGANKASPTHYWIVVPGAPAPNLRWVEVTCGTAALSGSPAQDGSAPATQIDTSPAPVSGQTQYILAASWEPAFCEGLPDKPECKAQTGASFEATHLSLHGLWPEPQSNAYCGVAAADVASDKARAWTALPDVNLSAPTRAELDRVMPGTRSMLERHEWTRHGTCYGTDQEHYFADAVTAMSALNGSAVQALFASRVGQKLTLSEIRSAFNTSFGDGAGARVRVACSTEGGRRLIGELTIGLSGAITSADKIGEHIRAAAPTSGGCPEGIVDAVGLR